MDRISNRENRCPRKGDIGVKSKEGHEPDKILEEGYSRNQEEPVQRPWGGHMLSVLRAQRG